MRKAALLLGAIMTACPFFASAASLYIDSDAKTYGLGDTFIASVRVDNEDECVNAARVHVTYPTDILRAVDFSRGGSIFTLWVEEPTLDTTAGSVVFSGGTPGGYCGRIPGDPVLSNVLGKIVFTVIGSERHSASIDIGDDSEVYLNDGRGTKASTEKNPLALTILDTPTLAENPWLAQVGEDTLPPDPFTIHIESTRGVFGGRYYIVFSTVDKQSGLDHFELFEHGAWKPVASPYELKDQFLPDAIQLRAIDKAGNERLGGYNKDDAPRRQFSLVDTVPIILLIVGVLGTLIILGFVKHYLERRKNGARNGGASGTYDDAQ